MEILIDHVTLVGRLVDGNDSSVFRALARRIPRHPAAHHQHQIGRLEMRAHVEPLVQGMVFRHIGKVSDTAFNYRN